MDKKYKQAILICWNNDGFGEKIKDQIEQFSLNTYNEIEKIRDEIEAQLRKIPRVTKIEGDIIRSNIKELEKNIEELEKFSFNAELCFDSTSLKKIMDKDGKAITHIIVLCELKWSHNNDNGVYSDMNGIKLIQDFIRTKERKKIPVLFVSYLKRKEIISLHADKKIINTPTLQHEFIDILEPVENWIEKISKMKLMSKLDLEYTLKNFCDQYGLVRSILHSISGINSIPAIKEQINTLKYVIKQLKIHYQDIEKMCENIEKMCDSKNNLLEIQEKIKKISEELSKRLNAEHDTSEKINVFYIEDEFNTDSRIISFREEAKKENINLFGQPDADVIKKAMEETEIGIFVKTLKADQRQYFFSTFNDIKVIICDIEIWDNPLDNKERLLIAQGYDFIKKMISFGYGYKKFLILTNCTRDMYSTITSYIVGKNRNVFIDIDNKDFVLHSEMSRKKYINKIRGIVNIKETPEFTVAGSIFDRFYNHIINSNKTFFWDKSRNYNEIESIIDKHLPIIIKAWEKNKEQLLKIIEAWKKNKELLPKTNEERKKNEALLNMEQEKIRGGLDFGGDFGKQERNTKQKNSNNNLDIERNIGNFVKKLIFRRFVIHLIEIEGVNLQDACLALSSDEKLYSNVLLFPKRNPDLQYSEEEKAYVDRKRKSSNPPPT